MDLLLVKKLSSSSSLFSTFTWEKKKQTTKPSFYLFFLINHRRRRFIHDLSSWYPWPFFNMTAKPSGRTYLTHILIPKFMLVESFVRADLCLKVKQSQTMSYFSINIYSFAISELQRGNFKGVPALFIIGG